MSKKSKEHTINIDGKEYDLEKLSEKAKEQLINIQFVDDQIQQLNNEWAVSDTARLGYTRALKSDLEQNNEKD